MNSHDSVSSHCFIDSFLGLEKNFNFEVFFSFNFFNLILKRLKIFDIGEICHSMNIEIDGDIIF